LDDEIENGGIFGRGSALDGDQCTGNGIGQVLPAKESGDSVEVLAVHPGIVFIRRERNAGSGNFRLERSEEFCEPDMADVVEFCGVRELVELGCIHNFDNF
jgi:hypothetical protein